MNSIEFLVRPKTNLSDSDVLEIVPLIDGANLVDLVAQFETEREFDVAGEYGGLVPQWFNYGPLLDYYLGGAGHGYWGEIGKIALLGCQCGEVGCWPFYARVDMSASSVTWTDFEQPHRMKQDYSQFGPYSFDRSEYERAVTAVTGMLESSQEPVNECANHAN